MLTISSLQVTAFAIPHLETCVSPENRTRWRVQLFCNEVIRSPSRREPSLWQESFTRGFQVSHCRITPFCPYSLRCLAGATWGLQLWITGEGDCREIFERAPLPQSSTRSKAKPATTDARWFCLILRFPSISCPNYTLGGAIYTATFAM